MAEDFVAAVEDGIKLSRRIYFGKDRAVAPPKPPTSMEKSFHAFLPCAPMVYAVIYDPGIVDNPDMPSYQPHVHGRCDPPALIPLQMNEVELRADCYLDTAFVTINGVWRVHCVKGSRSCDCRVAIPMGEQGSILGVEVSGPRKSYRTQLLMDENNEKEYAIGAKQAGFIKPNIFTLNIPEIDGGSNLSIKITWSQKLLYSNDEFFLNVPFTFPAFVKPAGKRIPKREKIQINVNAGVGSELLCKTISHPLKEVRRYAGSISLLYNSEVLEWSSIDFRFSYCVSSSHINGGVLLESASLHDFNQSDMFCMYLYPGNLQSSKVFKKDIVFVVDISGSMQGKLMDDIKTALSSALSKLDPDDSFSIIAFNGEIYLFSKSMELASEETVGRAIEWIKTNFVAEGATDILHPLNKAIELLSGVRSSIPMIFLVTDGSVENERHICDIMKKHMINEESICPRIYTFGIGSFCNHYFLSRLAMIGRGQYDAALDVDLIVPRMLKLFDKVSSLILANITIDMLNGLDEVEVYPSQIPDLSSEGPLMLSGRYKGTFPEKLIVEGVLADFSRFTMNLETQHAKDIPIQRVFAKQQIEHLTAEAWASQSKQIQYKIRRQVAKLSQESGFMSEYTRMVLVENDELLKKVNRSDGAKEASEKGHPPKVTDVRGQRIIGLPKLSIGFGNLSATVENICPGAEETKLPEAAEQLVRAAQYCCSTLCDQCCCACCITVCSRLNNQCVTALTQLCIGLGCLGCLSCCSELCCHGHE
ncbi:uncharacterized protein LOC129309839 isoform X1 [Prosopis cineraria]|uniref:uncharacterized protein LOC129309839 isoform X1 n=2 Tax=Prosopis cineraria TaxID=364024 RepID=UPI00240F4162|nr:uncharacterized protein LOC129309839 isoform X1 [Prosopis cineraria]